MKSSTQLILFAAVWVALAAMVGGAVRDMLVVMDRYTTDYAHPQTANVISTNATPLTEVVRQPLKSKTNVRYGILPAENRFPHTDRGHEWRLR